MQSGHGATVEMDDAPRTSALLFGESTGRALISFRPAEEEAVRHASEKASVPFALIGRVVGARLVFRQQGRVVLDEDVNELTELWRHAFRRAIESADLL